MQLEGRETPAVFQVSVSDPDGTPGSTDASHTGSLRLSPDLDQGNGFVYVKDATSAADAVRQAVVGSVRVTLGADSWACEAGPDTIGPDPAEHKPFLLEVGPRTGYKVALRFEDMAGRAGCDYDRNDREWRTFSVAGDPVDQGLIDAGARTLSDPDGHTAEVHWSVRWDYGGTDHLWRYDVTNNDLASPDAKGVDGFAVLGVESSPIRPFSPTTTLAGWDPAGPVIPKFFGHGTYSFAPGTTERFEFRNEATPIVEVAATIPVYPDGKGAGGRVPGPWVAARADIDIDGFDETTEDDLGGLVVRRAEGNNAPRKKVVIQKVLDGFGQVAPLGKARLTFGDKVKLYDAENDGAAVPSGTTFSNLALPRTLWVEGVTASSSMRDIPIKADPMMATRSTRPAPTPSRSPSPGWT